MAGAGEPALSGRLRRGRAALVAVGLVALIGGGGLIAYSSLTADESAPLPSATYSVSAEDAVAAASAAASPTQDANRLVIPRLDVSAEVLSTNVYATLPPAASVALDTGSDASAQHGSVLIAGHVSSHGTPGALNRLAEAKVGDVIYLTDGHGEVTVWAVNALQTYLKTGLPQGLATRKGARRLVLVTCGGPVVERTDGLHYRDNVVAYAVPVE